jgi:chromosome segregation ATPase
MLDKLQGEQDADSSHNAYCEKQIAESNAKKEDKQNSADKLTTKIDQMSARSAQLKKEVAAGQKALAKLASLQAEADGLRAEESAAYAKNKPEMEQGLEGIKMALQVLRDYYGSSDKAHSAAEGAGTGIVSLLETCESDFTRDLSEMVATEESAAAAYDQETKDNSVEKVTKEKDVEYKSKEYISLDKRIGEATSDRTGVQAELDAVQEYLKKLDDMCIAKPDTYAERKRRREEELAGLKEALSILEGEASLLQRRSLRRVSRHTK